MDLQPLKIVVRTLKISLITIIITQGNEKIILIFGALCLNVRNRELMCFIFLLKTLSRTVGTVLAF